jgi:hypothetical protein
MSFEPVGFSAAYMICAVGILIRGRREIPVVARALWPPKSPETSSP